MDPRRHKPFLPEKLRRFGLVGPTIAPLSLGEFPLAWQLPFLFGEQSPLDTLLNSADWNTTTGTHSKPCTPEI